MKDAIVGWLVVAVCCCLCAAQAPAPPSAQPPSKVEPANAAPDGAGQAKPEFPPAVKKNLYADHDLRGKAAPKLDVAKWLTDKPRTEGKVVLIDFWATWCGPCRRLIPELEAWQAKYKDDLVVIGISDEQEAKVRDHFKVGGMKYALAVDENARMKKSIGVKGIPHVLVIGTDNVVRWQGFPGTEEDELTEAKLKQIIDADKARALTEAIKKAPKELPGKAPRKPKGKGG